MKNRNRNQRSAGERGRKKQAARIALFLCLSMLIQLSPVFQFGLAGTARAEEEPQDCFADLPLKVAVIGGTDAWQAKVAERHPGFKIIGSSKNFDRDKLSGTDILVINTNAVSHACTQKAKGEVDRGTEILIISSNNLDILDKKIQALLM